MVVNILLSNLIRGENANKEEGYPILVCQKALKNNDKFTSNVGIALADRVFAGCCERLLPPQGILARKD